MIVRIFGAGFGATGTTICGLSQMPSLPHGRDLSFVDVLIDTYVEEVSTHIIKKHEASLIHSHG